MVDSSQDEFLKTKGLIGRLQLLSRTGTLYWLALGVLAFLLSTSVIFAYFTYKVAVQRETAAKYRLFAANLDNLHVRGQVVSEEIARLESLTQVVDSPKIGDKGSLKDGVSVQKGDVGSVDRNQSAIAKIVKDADANIRSFVNEVGPEDWHSDDGSRALFFVYTAQNDLLKAQSIIISTETFKGDQILSILRNILSKLSELGNDTYRTFEMLKQTSRLFVDLDRYSLYHKVDIPSVTPNIISKAFAETGTPPAVQPRSDPPGVAQVIIPDQSVLIGHLDQEEAKLYIFLAIFIVLMITFLFSLYAIFTTPNQAVLSFALDTVKTLLGFFIGAATVFLGLPSHG
jgi:hypothetical protein